MQTLGRTVGRASSQSYYNSRAASKPAALSLNSRLPKFSGRTEGLCLAGPAQYADFCNLVKREVSVHYPGTEVNYGAGLFASHLLGLKSFNTLRRSVWVFRSRLKPLAYFVASEKLNGLIKIGPIVVDPKARSLGIGNECFAALEETYRKSGHQALYGTLPSSKGSLRRLLSRRGYIEVAEIPTQYRLVESEISVLRSLAPERDLPNLLESAMPDDLPIGSRLWIATSEDEEMKLLECLPRANSPSSVNEALRTGVRRIILGDLDIGTFLLVSLKRGGSAKIGPWMGEPSKISRLLYNFACSAAAFGVHTYFALFPSGLPLPLGSAFCRLGRTLGSNGSLLEFAHARSANLLETRCLEM